MTAIEEVDWLPLLRSKKKLEREKGLTQLKAVLGSGPLEESERERLETCVFDLVSSLTSPWEEKHGGLMAAALLVPLASEGFCEKIKGEIPLLMENDELRIRLTTGELIGQLCQSGGALAYHDLEPYLLAGIRDNLERDRSLLGKNLTDKLGHSPSKEEERPSSPSAAQVFHDTAGWRHLETYMAALQHSVVGCGSDFEPFITSDLLQLIFDTLKHTNRFVRETGFGVLAAIVKCPNLSPAAVETHWHSVAKHLAAGLADNWSQVRMSASVATREFLTHLQPQESKAVFLPTLLPAMCLNRYYVAEGVRLYSQETWRLVTENKGVQLVEQHISQVVEFYISQSRAANHAVREAACTCIAELGNKVPPESLRPSIAKLVGVLLECFRDDSWPVRDAACLACGNFVACFPEECRPNLDELFALFFLNLEDSIPSVRQGAAVAIGNVVKAYGSEVEERVFASVKANLPLVASQPTTAVQTHPGIDPAPAVFGVVRKIQEGPIGRDSTHTDRDSTHTDQQMYSCGSLAPKMKRRGSGDGAEVSAFHKPAEPWEKSEGCVHLLAELAQQRSCADRAASLLPMVAEAARHKHYSQHYNFLETVLKQLPVMAKALGKRPFKRHLELFLDPIFYGLTCESALVRTASSDCLSHLCQLLGRVIMRGRVEQHNPQHLESFDRTV